MKQYDLIVIGSGPAGQKAAIQAAKLGRQVALIERETEVGGAAINTGTIPSKALREAALQLVRCAPRQALRDGMAEPATTLAELIGHCRHVIRVERDVIRSQMARNGVE